MALVVLYATIQLCMPALQFIVGYRLAPTGVAKLKSNDIIEL